VVVLISQPKVMPGHGQNAGAPPLDRIGARRDAHRRIMGGLGPPRLLGTGPIPFTLRHGRLGKPVALGKIRRERVRGVTREIGQRGGDGEKENEGEKACNGAHGRQR